MPVSRVQVSTSDPEVGLQALNDAYLKDGPPIVFHRLRSAFRFRLRSATVEELGGDTLRLTVETGATSPPVRHFHAATLTGGELDFRTPREHVRARRGDVLLYPNDTGHRGEWEDLEIAFVRVPSAAVVRAAQAQAGRAVDDLRFGSVRPVSAAAAHHWRTLTGFVHRTLTDGGPAVDSPLVRAELVGLVAATALTVFPNSVMTTGYVPDPGPALPAVLRRAVAYIEEHAAEPITVADVAAVARVTPRALQAAFRRRYGQTPTGYLRTVRLAGAHRDLQSADPTAGETVARVAARWGFGPGARFAAFYREQFGEPPARTLHT